MSITPLTSTPTTVSGTSSTLPDGKKLTTGDQSLGMNDFFQLLSAEMQYQDPSNPTSNDQFMQEMAQFSTLEAIQSLEKANNYSLGTQMLGKTVAYNQTSVNSNSQEVTSTVSGTVSAVDFTTDPPQCYVSSTASDGTTTGNWVAYTSINDVFEPASDTSDTSGTGTTTA